jgi:anaerobic magnesium-protoporphyrin IX monomethyl ester cyclase
MSTTAKIALVNPPTLKGVYHHQLYLPIGLAYLAAVLERSGHEVTVIDCPALEIDHEKLRTKLASFEPNVVGITSMTPTIQSTLLSARVAKEACPDARVVLGGPHATFMDREILDHEATVDIVVRGEGEQTLLELAQHAFDSKSSHGVDGITFRNGEQILRTPNRPFIQDLDQLPYPAYKYFPLSKYRLFGKLFLPIITSRGCPFQCSFCVSSRMFGKEYRARSPKNIVDELELLRDVYGADAFTFYDDTLTLDRKRIFEICREIKTKKISIPWDCQTRVDQVSKEVLAKMREANCQQIFFGVESGCQKILDAVKKKTSIEQNENAIRWAKDAGLFVAISVIIGYPGETTDTLKQTLDFIRKAEPDDVYLCVATPYPGTELRRLVEDMGLKMSTDWGLYDTITPVFENPLLSAEEIRKLRTNFYDSFYSPMYVLRHLFKGNFYGRVMARTALNHFIWRIRLWRIRSTF